MANELYRTQVVTQLGWKRSTLTFFWIANNLLLESSYAVSNGINANIFAGFGWLYHLTGLFGEQCRIRQVNTRRIDPAGAATFKDVVPISYLPGRLPGPVLESWITCWLKWHTATDATGKLGVRLGPLPGGIIDPSGYGGIFTVNVALFVAQHLAPRTTDSGVDFQGAARFGDGTAETITFYALPPPTSRQINRRMPF